MTSQQTLDAKPKSACEKSASGKKRVCTGESKGISRRTVLLAAGTLGAGALAMPIAKRFLPKLCLLYTYPSPRDATLSRMPSSA